MKIEKNNQVLKFHVQRKKSLFMHIAEHFLWQELSYGTLLAVITVVHMSE